MPADQLDESSAQIVNALNSVTANGAIIDLGEEATEFTAIELRDRDTDEQDSIIGISGAARSTDAYQALLANLFKWGVFDVPTDLLLMGGFLTIAHVTGLLSKIEDNNIDSSLLLFAMLGYVAALSIAKAIIEFFNPNKLSLSQAVVTNFAAGLVGFLVGSWGLFELRDDSFNSNDISVAVSLLMTAFTFSAIYNTCKLDINNRKESKATTEQHIPLLTEASNNTSTSQHRPT